MIIAINDSKEVTERVSDILSSLYFIKVLRGCVITCPKIEITDIAIKDNGGAIKYNDSAIKNKKLFPFKVLSKIKDWLFQTENTDHQEIEPTNEQSTIDFISQLIPFIKSIENTEQTEQFNNLYLQITPNNSFIKQKEKDYLAKREYNNYDQEILNSFDSRAGYINTQHGVIVFGTEVIKYFGETYKQKYGENEFLGFVYFHELSHQLDSNTKNIQSTHFFQDDKLNNSWSNNPFYQLILKKIDLFSYSYISENFNKLLEKSPFSKDFSPISSSFLFNIISLKKEFFADVGGLLFLRNHLLFNNPHLEPDEIKQRLQSIIEVREEELKKNFGNYQSDNPYEFEFEFIASSNHLTSRALKSLLDRIDNLPNQPLSAEQIADISHTCTHQAMAEHIYLLSQISPYFTSFMKTLSTLSINSQTGDIILDEKYINNYSNFIQFLKEHSKPDWIQELDTQLQSKEVSSLNIFQKFSLGFDSLSNHPKKIIQQKNQAIKNLQNTYFYSIMNKVITHDSITIPSLDSFLESSFSEASFDSVLSDNAYNTLLFPIENVINNQKIHIIQQTFEDDPDFNQISISNLENIISLHRTIYIEIESIRKLFNTQSFSVQEMSSFLDSQHIPHSHSSLLSSHEIASIYSTIQSQIQQHQGTDFDWDKIKEYYYIQSLSQLIKNNPTIQKDINSILSIEYNNMTGLPQKKPSSLNTVLNNFEQVLNQFNQNLQQDSSHCKLDNSNQHTSENPPVNDYNKILLAIQSFRPKPFSSNKTIPKMP